LQQDAFDPIPSEPFNAFDYGQPFNNHPQAHAFPGPPTPPSQNSYSHQYPNQQQSAQMQNGAANGGRSSSNGDAPGVPKSEGSAEDASMLRGSDDEDMTPAQSRRKAQNRAAQRAFRERKEKHVKDLEAKLAGLEAAQQKSSRENERLRQEMQKMSTENEILRATSNIGNGNGNHGHGHNSLSPEPTVTGPMTYKPTDFYNDVLQGHTNKEPSHRIVTSDDGERLLAAGATWDYVISHELFKRGLVNVGDVANHLRTAARCDGQGPVFSERSVIEAIHQSVASGSDDLL
jgi:AP-1-like factor